MGVPLAQFKGRYPLLVDVVRDFLWESVGHDHSLAIAAIWRLSQRWSTAPVLNTQQLADLAEEMLQVSMDPLVHDEELAYAFSGQSGASPWWPSIGCVRSAVRLLAYHTLSLMWRDEVRASNHLASSLSSGATDLTADEFLLLLRSILSRPSCAERDAAARALLAAARRGYLFVRPLPCDGHPVWDRSSAAAFATACAEFGLLVYLYEPVFNGGTFSCDVALLGEASEVQLQTILDAVHFFRFVDIQHHQSDHVADLYDTAVAESVRRSHAAAAKKLARSYLIDSLADMESPRRRDAVASAQTRATACLTWPDDAASADSLLADYLRPFTAGAQVLATLRQRVWSHRRRAW